MKKNNNSIINPDPKSLMKDIESDKKMIRIGRG
jgi:hypothetical protein